MTRQDFVTKLEGLRGATFATLVTNVQPDIKCPKTSGMAGRIRKRSRINCVLNHIYGNSVNYQREREGKEVDFTPNPRKWGERIRGTTLVCHKGKTYLEVKVEKVYDTQYYLDGQKVERDQVAEFLRERSTSSRQDLSKEVVLRDYNVDSIESVTMQGETIVLV